jgi:hypothetical protein
VTTYTNSSAPVNSGAAERERDLLTKALNSAIARERLNLHSLESIATALRHKQATVSEVKDWLASEGLEKLVARYLPGGSGRAQ